MDEMRRVYGGEGVERVRIEYKEYGVWEEDLVSEGEKMEEE